jgi:bacillithiol system protein YtxJ
MTNGFVEIADIASLDRLVSESNGSPIVIFKHSQTCGISARAFVEMQRLAELKTNPANTSLASVPIGIITIQSARAVSDEIEVRTGIEHESPQVLIIRDGQVVWSASHGEVKADRIVSALESLASSE